MDILADSSTHTHIYAHTNTHIYAHPRTHTHTLSLSLTRTHTHNHPPTHSRPHTHIHTHTHTHAHTPGRWFCALSDRTVHTWRLHPSTCKWTPRPYKLLQCVWWICISYRDALETVNLKKEYNRAASTVGVSWLDVHVMCQE